jgi:ribosomal protein S18 acetylase RimI-like enzyme
MMSIHIASVDDVDTVISLGKKTYTQHFSDIWSAAGIGDFLSVNFDKTDIQNKIRNNSTTYLLHKNEMDEYIGFAKINWNRNIPNTELYGAELQKLYYLKGFTGNGYGKQMIGKCMETAIANKESVLWLDVLKSNLGAKKFYERNGFVLCGEVDFSTDIKDIGLFVMKRNILQENK